MPSDRRSSHKPSCNCHARLGRRIVPRTNVDLSCSPRPTPQRATMTERDSRTSARLLIIGIYPVESVNDCFLVECSVVGATERPNFGAITQTSSRERSDWQVAYARSCSTKRAQGSSPTFFNTPTFYGRSWRELPSSFTILTSIDHSSRRSELSLCHHQVGDLSGSTQFPTTRPDVSPRNCAVLPRAHHLPAPLQTS